MKSYNSLVNNIKKKLNLEWDSTYEFYSSRENQIYFDSSFDLLPADSFKSALEQSATYQFYINYDNKLGLSITLNNLKTNHRYSTDSELNYLHLSNTYHAKTPTRDTEYIDSYIDFEYVLIHLIKQHK